MTDKFITDKETGIRIPTSLADHMVDIDSIQPNPWNPNRMEPFMRGKLVGSVKADGFVVPVMVRPHPTIPDILEVVDGEHRWAVAKELGLKRIPIVNLGPISDEKAKELTIKMNSLRGEFDSIRLSQVVQDITNSYGKDGVIDVLPYTPERIDSLLALCATNLDNMAILGTASEPAAPTASEKPTETFKAFTPDSMAFEHKCPRCGLEFNSPKEAA